MFLCYNFMTALEGNIKWNATGQTLFRVLCSALGITVQKEQWEIGANSDKVAKIVKGLKTKFWEKQLKVQGIFNIQKTELILIGDL